MGDDYLELANRLFATATEVLEDATDIAVAGQSPQLTPAQLAELCQRLRAEARYIAIIAEAAQIVADLGKRDQRRLSISNH